MLLKRLFPLVILSAIILISLYIGCDKLVTERITIIEAGHPIAEFRLDTGSVDVGCAPHEVTFKDISSGSYDQVMWYFGDGDSSSEANPTHTYDTAGLFTVILRIMDSETDGEDTEEKKRFIFLGAGNATFSVSLDSACSGEPLEFTPQILSTKRNYNWQFGDGSVSSEVNPTHSYPNPGLYWAKLAVDDNCGTVVDSQLITVANCPTLVIASNRTEVCEGDSVEFKDLSYPTDPNTNNDIDITSRIWDFGVIVNASKKDDDSVFVQYNNPGTYTVKLKLSSIDSDSLPGGESIDSIIEFITVHEKADSVDFGYYSDTMACQSQLNDFHVNFRNQTPGTYDSLKWEFGDGATSTEENPNHAYTTPGIYNVRLTVYYDCSINGDNAKSSTLFKENVVHLYDLLKENTTGFSYAFDSVSTDLLRAYYTFIDTSSGVISSRTWDFDDGNVVLPSDTIPYGFKPDTTFTVSLTISNGCNTIKFVDTISTDTTGLTK